MNTKNEDSIKLNGELLKDVNKCEYLGATGSAVGGGTMDLHNRLGKARAAFGRLKAVWNSNKINRNTKLKLFKTLVKPDLMYGSETWKITKSDNKKTRCISIKMPKKNIENKMARAC